MAAQQDSTDDVLNPVQVGELIQCHWRTCVRYAERGIIPGRKIGCFWRFSRQRLLEWIQSNDK